MNRLTKSDLTVAGLFLVPILIGGPRTGIGTETDRLTIIPGFDYSSGDYGQEIDTDIQFLPVTFKYDSPHWSAKVVLSYLRLTGPDNIIIVGGDGTVVTDRKQEPSTREGFGDVLSSLTYKVQTPLLGHTYIDLTTKLKLPTASTRKGLGTGEYDVTVQADLLRSSGPWTPFATIGCRFLGDLPEQKLNDGLLLTAGIDYRYNDSWSGGTIFDFRQAATDDSDDARELIPYLTLRMTPTWSVNGYGVIGFSDGSPDFGLGVQLLYTVP